MEEHLVLFTTDNYLAGIRVCVVVIVQGERSGIVVGVVVAIINGVLNNSHSL